jgi:hypothetical protein
MRANAPGWQAFDLRMMFQGYFDRGFTSTETEVARVTKLLGHTPRSYEGFAAETAAVWNLPPWSPRPATRPSAP